MSRVLLHVCCGPCAIEPVRMLRDEGHQVTGFFHNPNIHPLTEYLRRRDALLETADRLELPLILADAEYDPQPFFRAVAGREDTRCAPCYGLRLARTEAEARQGGFDAFSTTLLYSIYQRHQAIADAGEAVAAPDGPAFLYRDFRPGWQQGVDQSREWGIYRQPYCGCLYSEFERFRRKLGRAEGKGDKP